MADISNDGFIRTTDKGHCEAVKKAFSDFYKSKYIYLGQ
jgi:methionyl-tRNA synthetase